MSLVLCSVFLLHNKRDLIKIKYIVIPETHKGLNNLE